MSGDGLERRVIVRTPAAVRAWHWINALVMFFLLASGLQIFNAHPALYFGQAADFDHPALSLRAYITPHGLEGRTAVFGRSVVTTGLLGASNDAAGHRVSRGFPTWVTLPSGRDLASGRRWHFFAAWFFVANGLVYVAYLIGSGRALRALLPTLRDLRSIPRSILDHMLLKRHHGWEAARFNVLQKIAYLVVLFALLPLMALTGLAMSPGMDAAAPGLLVVFGGRQSARTVHFLVAAGLVTFFAVHIFEVFAAGPLNELRSIITGRFVVRVPPGSAPEDAEAVS